MPTPSSYLRFLPPVLWEKDAPCADLSLGTFLCIFEKILTGIPDGVPQSRPPIEQLIDWLPRLFDPWQTPSAYLPWLASWVGLTIPKDWDDYRSRRAIGSMVGLYQVRGSLRGLAQLLTLYTAGPLQPRIVIDDGSKLLGARLDPLAPAALFTLQSQGPCILGGRLVLEGLVCPQCVAVDPSGNYFDGDLFVGDSGYSDGTTTVPARLWRLSASGAYPIVNGTPQPIVGIRNDPANPQTISNWTLGGATAVALRKVGQGQVWFLDASPPSGTPNRYLYKIRPINDNNLALGLVAEPFILAGSKPFPPPAPFTPVDLVVNPAVAGADEWTNDVVILDRGALRALSAAAQPKLWVLTNPENTSAPGHPFTPVDLRSVALTKVIEPLSIAVLGRDDFLIGDGGLQTQTSTSGPADLSGNLVRVQLDRSNPATWVATETVVLTTPATNPLVSPLSLAPTGGNTDPVLVLDTGLKPVLPKLTDHMTLDAAKPAAVYRVTLPTATSATLVTQPGRLVFPQALALVGDLLYICDPGMPPFGGLNGTNSPWRVRPYAFGVVIHFPSGLMPTDATAKTLAQKKTQGAIRDVVNREIPAHVSWKFFTQAGG